MSSDAVWRAYGEEDPYYGVLTLEAYRKGSIAANREAFFATGEAAVAEVLARVEAAIGPVGRGHALDFGAGVGRLSLPLAARFAAVTSIDVSPGMLRELGRNAAARAIATIIPRGDIDGVPATVDFALSLIVLQHIAPARGLATMLAIWDRLAPGGAMALEVPIASSRSAAWHRLRRIRDRVPYAQTLWNRLRGRPAHDGGMEMNLYSLPAISAALFARGASAVTLLPSAPDPHFSGALVVCRKG